MKTLLAIALAAAPLAAAQAEGPYLVQETGKTYSRLIEAVDSVHGGDATVIIQPGTYKDCEVVEHGRVAFRARVSGSVIFDGGICEGKAAFVFRGQEAMIDGIVFRNMHVQDGNGAGIRLEHGGLTVMNATFKDSDEGVLTADDPNGVIRVDRSTFQNLGSCAVQAGCAHSLYIGHYGRLYVTRSRFETGAGGHYLKSRSAYVSIVDNSFDDSHGHQTNYIIDLPSGATGVVRGNTMVMGRDKENHSGFIAVRAEENRNPSAGLTITGNTATNAPGVSFKPAFVLDWSHEALKISGNTLGAGITPFQSE
jgi:hypothetical protein